MTPEHSQELQLLNGRLLELEAEIAEPDRNFGPPYPTPDEAGEMLNALDRLYDRVAGVEDRIAQIRRLYEGV